MTASTPRQFFHFTLGPVQGFVSQARRTRDFWAGSFLLSWLAGVAMVAVRRQGGTIDFPKPPDNYLGWIEGQASGEPPRQGAIPNRFKSMCAEVPAAFKPELVVSAVNEAWQALAEHVWQADRLDEIAGPDSHTRAIWQRQHAHFWEISWALTDDEQATALLDQRKNWRTSGFGQHEPGPKCMVMDGWQELSGAERPGPEATAFWRNLRESRDRCGLKTDLGDGEQLCALAYVKRRFARHFVSFSTTLPGSGVTLHGWKLSVGMPSVSYMAAVHWLETLLKTCRSADLRPVLQAALDVSPEQSEWDTHIECLRDAVPRWHSGQLGRELLALDGNLFFRHVQEQPRAHGYEPADMDRLRQALSTLREQYPKLPAAPSPYYAILLMDGDSLGVHMSQKANQQPISKALEEFTADPGVPRIVREHNGCLIYAGGDDVLALLPLEDALGCAARIRAHYLTCFKTSGIPTTISAAIEFVHVKTPLGLALADAHPLLDDVAKDGCGRDALAVRVWKTGGTVLQWAQPWKVALAGSEGDGLLAVERLARLFSSGRDDRPAGGDADVDLDANHGRFSSKFFFKIEERLAVLDPARHRAAPKQVGKNPAAEDDDMLPALLAVDFWHSDTNRDRIDLAAARALIEPLLRQCRPHRREVKDGRETPVAGWIRPKEPLQADGALLVRFLATKGLDGSAT
ncbi:MAG: hypothetical protein RL260_3909 [Pseudomonadota bacterium]